MNIRSAKVGFSIIETTEHTQVATMVLAPGECSSPEMNIHERSDQVLILWSGELRAEIGNEKRLLKSGDICLGASRTPHRFCNQGEHLAVTFNIYSPPEYSAE